MPTTLVVRFVWGRYHATPWGRHVNEGQVELPPSPWRLLRALYAVWRTRVPDLAEGTVRVLLTRLAEPPTYLVPPYRVSHTRHYYPDSKHRTGAPSVDRTLDAFAVVRRGAELGVRWPFDLPADERAALERLAGSLPHLGRADSLCEARVDDGWQPSGEHATCAPPDAAGPVTAGGEVVPLLAPALPLDPHALVARPVDVRAGRLLFPLGTRFVEYRRPPEHHPRGRRVRRSWELVTAVRFTVTEVALPPETDAVAVADLLRATAVRKVNDVRGHVPGRSLLAGRDADGQKLRDHVHAHYLALADGERRLAELAVWVPGGLDEQEMEALSRVRHLRPPEGMPGPGPLELRMSAYGEAAAVLAELAGPARVWRTATPFVPPRHARRDWTRFVAREVRREVASRSLPEPVSVEVDDDQGWRAFLRYRPTQRLVRDGGGRDGAGARRGRGAVALPGASVRITFGEPVAGPLALGHLSHFGLGLFRPV